MNLAPYAWSFPRCEVARIGEFLAARQRPLEYPLIDQSLIVEARLACSNPEAFAISRRLLLLGRLVDALEILEAQGLGKFYSPDELPLTCLIVTARQVLCEIAPRNDRLFVHVVRHLGLVLEVGDLTLRTRQPGMRWLH
ncbi:hypothetical protein J2W42_006439 [Rhizobium tibeticum]|nr:hypothetical protein [Rhizobium tibeticum]